MGVAVTGAIYKGLTFNGVDSRDYGVYITGAAVFDAPARDVEFITIPGRNGEYALDHGRWENIEVSYPAGMFADNEADFAQGISEFRNAICSQVGYQRLEDDYNPGEYRLAVYTGGLEVDPAELKAGEFTIKFTCKPQRFLTSGEEAVPGTASLSLTNPTLFDARPLIKAVGYGPITINGEAVTIADNPIGDVRVAGITATSMTVSSDGTTVSGSVTIYPNYAPLLPGDTVTIGYSSWGDGHTSADFTIPFSGHYSDITGITYTTDGGLNAEIRTGQYASVRVPTLTYTAGQATNRMTETVDFTVQTTTGTTQFRAVIGWQVLPHPGVFDVGFDFTMTRTSYTGTPKSLLGDAGSIRTAPFIGFSTYTATTEPIYIDLDVGEAYTIVDGSPVSYNSNVSLPATLPVLKPGANTITKGQHIDSYEITPRWWKL